MGLVKKRIVDKNGKRTHVWVNPDKDIKKKSREAVLKKVKESLRSATKVERRIMAKNDGELSYHLANKRKELIGGLLSDRQKGEYMTIQKRKTAWELVNRLSESNEEIQAKVREYNEYLNKVDKHGVKAKLKSYDDKLSELTGDIKFPEEFWYMGGIEDISINTTTGKTSKYVADSSSIKISDRKNPEIRKRVIAHELGHAHHYHSGLLDDGHPPKFAKVIGSAVEATRDEVKANKKLDKYVMREIKGSAGNYYSKELDKYNEKVGKRTMADLAAIANDLIKDAGIDASKHDQEILEDQALSFMDVLMASDPVYGFGHSTNYYIDSVPMYLDGYLTHARAMEWYAHSAEHVFHRRNIFVEKLLPKTHKRWVAMWDAILKTQKKKMEAYV